MPDSDFPRNMTPCPQCGGTDWLYGPWWRRCVGCALRVEVEL
jgi:hypothetical protein